MSLPVLAGIKGEGMQEKNRVHQHFRYLFFHEEGL